VKKFLIGGTLAALSLVVPLGALASVGGAGTAGAAAPHRSLTLYNVPPLAGRHLLRFGLGRLRNMTQVSSTNWSGYADIDDTFGTISGSWTEPSVSCAPSSGGGLLGLGGSGASASYSSFWVGLDGYTSTSVEQIGTSADCTSSGAPSYYAWYEMYPAGEQDLSASTYPVAPGDVITGSVTSSSPDAFTLTLTDGPLTHPKWKTSMNLSGSNLARSSAEWVAEAPSSCNILFCSGLPLADFKTVTFTGAHAVDTSGVAGSIAAFTDAQITMENDGTTMAVPEGLSDNGTSFIVNWTHS
jgi:hypothetical protein